MYNVSPEYKSQIKNTLRNPSYLKIDFSVIDPQAVGDSALTDNGHLYYSNLDGTELDYEVTNSYMTLEHNRFILDGVNTIPEPVGGTFNYQGFVGDEISDETGLWIENPKITIDFLTTYFTFVGLTFSFDTILNEYPRELQIIAYDDGVEVYNEIKTPNSASDWTSLEAIPECNKMEFISLESGIPNRRFRLENILFGIKKVFTDSIIEKANWKRDVDLVDSKLPISTFDFTVIDIDREYDPENPTGIYSYMEQKQPITFKFGYELDDGSIEWIEGGNTFTTGELKVTSESVIPKVDFKTISTLGSLTQLYTEGLYYSTPISLYDLAEDVLIFAGLPLHTDGGVRWSIDSSLQTLYTTMPLPKVPVNVALQMIANAGMCVLDTDRIGDIIIKQHNTLPQDFGFTLADVLTTPTTSKYPILMGVDTVLNTLNIATASSELGKFDIVGASSTTYEFEYQTAKTITAVAGAGVTIVGTPQYFANMCRIVLTGTGTLTINGYLINVKKDVVSVEFNSTGERCPIENSLIISRSHAIAYATWIGNYVNRRNEYTFEDRGFPELDCGDEITLNTLFTNDVDVTLISTEINYNGAISGKTKVLID